jgi:hypothetical protein
MYVYEKGAELLIIGNGHYGRVGLSNEAKRHLKKTRLPSKTQSHPEGNSYLEHRSW